LLIGDRTEFVSPEGSGSDSTSNSQAGNCKLSAVAAANSLVIGAILLVF